MEHDLDTQAGYSRWAEVYDSVDNPTRDLDALVLRRVLDAIPAQDVVELGCGTGKNTVWLAERFATVTALDLTEAMLAKARERVPAGNVRFLRHDLREPLPVEDDSADLATLDLVLEHIEKIGPVLSEAARVLRPGGRLFLCEYHPYRQLDGRQARFVDPESGQEQRVEAYVHSVAEFVNAGIDAGMTVERVDEWDDAGHDKAALPRLLSILFRR